MNQDAEHLRLLSIFHYVVAGLTAMFSLFPVIHLALGITMVVMPEKWAEGGELPPAFLAWFLIILASVIILAGLTLSFLIALNGVFIKKRRRWLFCVVVAGLECLVMPFGTALGVLTLLVFMRDSVKEEFNPTPPPPVPQSRGGGS